MGDEDLIGVVTVTYNSAEVLPDFLRCLFAQTHHNFILFAIDNASKDDTINILHRCTDRRLTVIANPDNCGVAAGNNQGIRAALEAGCDSVLLINNDTEFEATLIANLLEGLAMHRVGMTCPKMMYYDEPQRIWAAGGTFQPWLGYRSVHLGGGEIDRGQYDLTRLVTYTPTCCVLIARPVFHKIGLMDERFVAQSCTPYRRRGIAVHNPLCHQKSHVLPAQAFRDGVCLTMDDRPPSPLLREVPCCAEGGPVVVLERAISLAGSRNVRRAFRRVSYIKGKRARLTKKCQPSSVSSFFAAGRTVSF
jgi:hypothetical protein